MNLYRYALYGKFGGMSPAESDRLVRSLYDLGNSAESTRSTRRAPMLKLLPALMSLGSFVEHEAADQPSRERAETSLELVLDALSHLTPATTVLGKACAAALKVLHDAETVAGDPNTGGSPPAPASELK